MLFEKRFPRKVQKFKNKKFGIKYSVTLALIFRVEIIYFNLRGKNKKMFSFFFFLPKFLATI